MLRAFDFLDAVVLWEGFNTVTTASHAQSYELTLRIQLAAVRCAGVRGAGNALVHDRRRQ